MESGINWDESYESKIGCTDSHTSGCTAGHHNCYRDWYILWWIAFRHNINITENRLYFNFLIRINVLHANGQSSVDFRQSKQQYGTFSWFVLVRLRLSNNKEWWAPSCRNRQTSHNAKSSMDNWYQEYETDFEYPLNGWRAVNSPAMQEIICFHLLWRIFSTFYKKILIGNEKEIFSSSCPPEVTLITGVN